MPLSLSGSSSSGYETGSNSDKEGHVTRHVSEQNSFIPVSQVARWAGSENCISVLIIPFHSDIASHSSLSMDLNIPTTGGEVPVLIGRHSSSEGSGLILLNNSQIWESPGVTTAPGTEGMWWWPRAPAHQAVVQYGQPRAAEGWWRLERVQHQEDVQVLPRGFWHGEISSYSAQTIAQNWDRGTERV